MKSVKQAVIEKKVSEVVSNPAKLELIIVGFATMLMQNAKPLSVVISKFGIVMMKYVQVLIPLCTAIFNIMETYQNELDDVAKETKIETDVVKKSVVTMVKDLKLKL